MKFIMIFVCYNVYFILFFFILAMDKCKLFCRAARYNFFFQMNDKVIDGTRCDDEGDDVCINGKCQVGAHKFL